MSASPVGEYNRLQYVHDLLLQKSNGDYYLLLWHEVADAATSDGTSYPSTAVDIQPGPPGLPVVITVPASVNSADVYTYASDWALKKVPISLNDHKIKTAAGDTITILLLHTNVQPPQLHPPKVALAP